MRAAQDGAVKHAGQRDIRGIHSRTAHPFVSIHPGNGLADDPGFLPGCRAFTRPGRFRDREIFERYCDASKARELLNWEPTVQLREGIEKVIQAGVIFDRWANLYDEQT